METAKAFLRVSGRLIFFFLVLGLATAPAWAQTTINANWVDYIGNWTTPSKWSCNCVPNNSSANVFNVTIPTGEVHLDNTSSPSTITVNSVSPSGGLLFLRGAAGAPRTLLKVSSLAPSSLTGFYLVDQNAALEFAGGSITQISGELQLSGDGYVEVRGATGSNSALTGLRTITGGLQLAHGASLSTTGALTNNGGLAVANGGTLHVGGDLTMSGESIMDIGGYYDMTSTTTVTVAGTFSSGPVPKFTDFGLAMVGGSVPGAPALLNVSGAAPDTLTGNYDLRGNAGGAALEYGSGGITQLGAAAVTLEGPNALMELSSATGSNSALASLNTVSDAGELVQLDGNSLSTAGPLINRGTIELGGYYYNGEAGSALTVGGDLTNAGTVLLQRTNTLAVGAGHTYAQTAGSTLVDGTLMAPIVHITGGTLSGSGVIDGSVVNHGIVSLYDPNAPFRNVRLTTDGNYTQDADGTLVIDVWGSNHFDVLDVSGKASLDGTVNFDFLNGYVPGSNADFAFLTAGSVAGDFAALNLVGIKCPTCTLTLNLGTLSLDTGSRPPTITPEPGTLILFGTGLLGLATLTRKGWSRVIIR
jgi:hypothetical protein